MLSTSLARDDGEEGAIFKRASERIIPENVDPSDHAAVAAAAVEHHRRSLSGLSGLKDLAPLEYVVQAPTATHVQAPTAASRLLCVRGERSRCSVRPLC